MSAYKVTLFLGSGCLQHFGIYSFDRKITLMKTQLLLPYNPINLVEQYIKFHFPKAAEAK